MKVYYCIFTFWTILHTINSQTTPSTEEEVESYLKTEYEPKASSLTNIFVESDWNFATDIANSDKEKAKIEATLNLAKFNKEEWNRVFNKIDPQNYANPFIKRQIQILKVLGNAALDETNLKELTEATNEMTNIYSTAKICPYSKPECNLETEGLSLEPGIESVLATSNDYEELKYVWKAWRDASGAKMKTTYKKYVDLSNKAATLNEFNDKGEMWRNDYESPNFETDLDNLWGQVKPLYDELHTYVGHKLKEKYGNEIDISDGLLPAHVLGNMWGQSWINIGKLVQPFPNVESIDVTAALQAHNYSALNLFEESDKFYKSLRLEPNDMSYNVSLGAVITKPTDREILCHASAWDFSNGKDFRIKMCTEVNYEDFVTVHHEMGHIQYFLLYKDQPIAFRNGANPGFHEAVGDTIALSVATPKHLEKIGLLDTYVPSQESDLNVLMDMALERVAFLPFGLLIDKWRWDVFSGKVDQSKWNEHWWKYRQEIQKVKSPIPRSDTTDFDPGAKFHVPGDSQYINYFVAHILEFQLYRSLCKLSGEYDPSDPKKPLHSCDFYESKEVGQKLRAGLSLGWSKHWKDSLKEMTDETDLDGTALIEYFKPLYDFLKIQNQIYTEDGLKDFLTNTFENEASKMSNKVSTAEWNLATDIENPANQNAQLQATLEAAKFNKHYWTTAFQTLKEDDYNDEELKRQVKSLKILGSAALNEDKLSQLTSTRSKMENIYSTAKICPFNKQNCTLETEGLSLEPGIEKVLANSRDYDELKYVWGAWRNATGKKMKESYQTYVKLSNEAAVANGFHNMGEMWQYGYESETFEKDLDELWEQVKPLYNELHKYVGTKLKEVYGDKLDMEDGLIPAHVFGNMWAQSWINLAPLLTPFPNASVMDVTSSLIDQGYSPREMFETSDEFYTSLGLESNAMSYGDLALIVKPDDREVLCHASAWDFSDGKDFRIKMCTEVNYEDFITIHHEMGHIQYYILYKDQPYVFRGGANPGFHEAVGDTIALSVSTPKHLKKINLLDENYEQSQESDLNALMNMALERVAFLPFGLLIDKWRWDVFAERVNYNNWNQKWWDYRNTIQKVKSPVNRSETDFDPGAKYHVPGDSQYINYFIAHILQFQLYRSLCKTSGQYDPNNASLPLHQCDFYQSTKAGEKLRNGLKLGASQHWKVALKEMTGEDNLDASAILEYFDPLYKYLQRINSMDEEHLKEYLSETYEKEASQKYNKLANAQWDFATDVDNKDKEAIQLQVTLEVAKYSKGEWSDLFQYLNEEDYNDESIKRQVRFLKVIGDSALDEDKLTELSNAGSYMTNIYSTAKICPFDNRNCSVETEGWSLEPDIESRLAHSDNYEELEYIWTEWRKVTGPKMKDRYKDYARLSNEAAVANGFMDKGELWRSSYESPTFVKDMDRIWEQVKPLYHQLHKYVMKKLKEKYGTTLNVDKGFIPAHVLGNMWAQSWINLQDLVRPFSNGTLVDVTNALQNYSVKELFEKSNEFYTSLGLESCEMSYGPKAVIEKPSDREILCHASAWDFYDKSDFRIKMCTEVNYEDFITIHHEMGHIEYDILYKDQPISFRDGANPGFHEAVGDTIALSVTTPKHLEEIGLLENYDDSYESSINTLMKMALERVAFLPFGLLIDKWRWDVFAGLVTPEQWNSHWWHYRETIQKVTPPVSRNDATDFDPGAKYHIPGDSQYINYFFAHILEFQLYRALCIKAGKYDPSSSGTLHKCDFYQSKDAGELLRKGLSMGKSKHWKDALEVMTGSRDLDASALLEYFQPLFEFLMKDNGPLTDEKELKNFLMLDYELSASHSANDQVEAEWNFVTDVSNADKEQAQVDAALRAAQLKKVYWNTYFKSLKGDDYKDELIKKQLKSLKLLGNAALDEDDLKEYTETVNEMTKIYSTAKICPYKRQNCNLESEGLQLEPDIEEIMASSNDYAELAYVWKEWRHATSGIKGKYVKYVDLSNTAAKANGFNDKGHMWRSLYDSSTFIEDMDKLWTDVKPLYDQLHKFVSKKLKEKYKEELDVSDNLIPAHLLGNMWAQTWTNIFPLVKPYPNATSPNITAALLEKGYTPLRMFETSDEFYKSLGLESNHMSYNVTLGAIIEKPNDREILCHASAWDFSNGKDYRIKMCTNVNQEDFITVHHEMGHIQYFILYKDQPITFRDSANPGFHEAVGDAVALSVATPEHLYKIGLLKDKNMTEESSINALMEMALERVAFLPFGLLIDKWRWDVFSGMVPREEWNHRWWNYRNELQGIKAPVNRSGDDFDPAAKYHVAGDSQYINYFVARILQFQIYKALCIEAGQYAPQDNKPLHKCDFYQSVKAGQKLRAGLSLGSSKHWSEALYAITGEKQLNASALLEYFDPLMVYMKAQNQEPEESSSQLVPILVGSILGVILVAGLAFYLIRRFRKKGD